MKASVENGKTITIEQIKELKPENWELSGKLDLNTFKEHATNIVYIKKVADAFETKLIFKNSKTQKIVISVNAKTIGNEKIKLSEYVPKGYKLIDNQLEPVIGKDNTYLVEPITDIKTTILIFKVKEGVVAEARLELETVNVEDYIPHGYELVDPKNTKVKLGETNTYEVKLKVRKTEIIFRDTNSKIISSETFDTEKDVPLKYKLPKGYELLNPNQIPSITWGNINYIDIKKVPADAETVFKFRDVEDPSRVFEPVHLKLTKGDKVEWNKILPLSYRLVNPEIANEFTIGATNYINIKKVFKIYKTVLIFEGENKQEVVTVTSSDDEKIDVSKYVPYGWKLKYPDKAKAYVLGGSTENIYEIVKDTKSNSEDAPVHIDETDEPITKTDTKKLSIEELNKILKDGGVPLQPESKFIEKESTLPKVDNPDTFTEAEKAKFKSQINSVLNKLSSNTDLTADDLKELYASDYATNKDLVEMFAKYLNGSIEFYGPNKPSREELRQIYKAQLEAALRIMDQELAKGNAPDFTITGNTWGYDLTIRFGSRDDNKNPTKLSIMRDNKKRYFGVDSKFYRQGSQIMNGEYPGWSKQEVSNSFSKYITNPKDRNKTYIDKNGVVQTMDDGIRIYEYTPDPTNTEFKDKAPRTLVEVDTSNALGIENYKKLMNSEEGKKILLSLLKKLVKIILYLIWVNFTRVFRIEWKNYH